jgi:hypothetical protein
MSDGRSNESGWYLLQHTSVPYQYRKTYMIF